MLAGSGEREEISRGGKKPEALLEYADWMGIPIIPHEVSLDRFKDLLSGIKGSVRSALVNGTVPLPQPNFVLFS